MRRGEGDPAQRVGETTTEVLQVRASETTAPPCLANLQSVVNLIRGDGEEPLEVDPHLFEPQPLRVKLGQDALEKVITLIIVLLDAFPDLRAFGYRRLQLARGVDFTEQDRRNLVPRLRTLVLRGVAAVSCAMIAIEIVPLTQNHGLGMCFL